MTRLNDLLGWFIVAVVLLSPIPLGSNPPIFWAISGTLVGAVALIYFGRVLSSGQPLRFPINRIWPVAILFACLCAFLIVQILPLGYLFGPFKFMSLRGVSFETQMLSLAPGSTWMMLIRMLSYGLFFMLAAQVSANEGRADRLVKMIFWATVAHAAFGLIQLTQLGDTLLGADKKYYMGFATGTFVNRNSYATFMAMGMAIGTGLLAQVLIQISMGTRRLSDELLNLVATVGGIFVLLLAISASQSRMGLLSAAVAVGVVMLLAIRWIKWRSLLLSVSVAVGVVIVFLVALLVFGPDLLQRVIMTEATGGGRSYIYEQTWSMILTRPWTGFGGGSFELAFPLFEGPPLSPDFLVDKAHSTYLTLWSELGLVAGSLPMAIVVILFGGVVLRYFRLELGSGVKLAAIGAVIAGATHSTIDFSLEMQANTYLFVALLGIGQSVGLRRASH